MCLLIVEREKKEVGGRGENKREKQRAHAM